LLGEKGAPKNAPMNGNTANIIVTVNRTKIVNPNIKSI
jgi:hypothetical protein